MNSKSEAVEWWFWKRCQVGFVGRSLARPLEIRLAHTRTDQAKISVKYELRVGEALNAAKAGSSRCGRLRAFDEFETDLIRMRTREGMAIAKAKGKLRGKQPNLSGKQRKEL